MDFGIVSPTLGVRDNLPRVLLSEAFINKNSRNVIIKDGVVERMKGRLPSLLDDDNVKIGVPLYVHAITGVDQGNKKFTISGNHATNITANSTIRVNGSTGNDQLYTFVSATDVGGDTEVVVSDTVSDATVDGNLFVGLSKVLKILTHTHTNTGVDYLLLATADNVFLWNYSNKTLTSKFSCASACVEWSIVSLQNKVYATNNSDKIQVWDVDTPSGSFTVLDGASGLDLGSGSYCTAAKYLFNFWGYLIVGYTTEDGSSYPKRLRWCTQYDPTDFDETSTEPGHKDFETTGGFLRGFGRYLDYLVVAKSDDMISGYLTTEDTVFVWDDLPDKVGCLSGDTFVNDKDGNLYWLADDLTIRSLGNNNIVPQIKNTVKSLNEVGCLKAVAVYNKDYNYIYLAVPSGGSSTNDLILAIELERGTVTIADMDVSCFGFYSQQSSFTYDTLPYATFDEWGAAWGTYDYGLGDAGAIIALAADQSGYVYEFAKASTDKGETLTGYCDIETNLKTPFNLYKRLNDRIRLFLKSLDSGTITLDVLVDGSDTWYRVGSASLINNDSEWMEIEFACDIRARHFTFRIESSSLFVFYGMMLTNFEMDGDT